MNKYQQLIRRNLSERHGSILVELIKKPHNMTELSVFAGVTQARTTTLIDQLSALNMVSRFTPANDRRAQMVKLTARGLVLAIKIR